MNDFAATFQLTRTRFEDALKGLSTEQLNFRLHADTLTIGEMALHIAGVEFFVIGQLLDETYDEATEKLRRAARDGALNDAPFPFTESEITPELVQSALASGRQKTEAIMTSITPEIRAKEIVSALGPIIDGVGALARLSFHPGYHHGQIWMIKSAPSFPATP